jgi:alcohol dehydrogenase
MTALVYGGPGSRSWSEVPDRRIRDARDVMIRVDAAIICGTGLHILGRVQPMLSR